MKKNISSEKKSTDESQTRSTRLTDLMLDSERKGREFRKQSFGQDVLTNKIQHPESKEENPKI